ncbi:MAG TPA: shikimate kinase, partial [Clostridiales bacterium]|nr:shikimate kinase [Clostridiales bacterium]
MTYSPGYSLLSGQSGIDYKSIKITDEERMELLDIRKKIDALDNELVAMLCARMDLSDLVAHIKQTQKLPVYAPLREAALKDRLRSLAGSHGEEVLAVYETILEKSRRRQITVQKDIPIPEKPFGLLGEHLSHSYSVKIHALLGSYPYVLFPTKKDNVQDFLESRIFSGLNVTIPYKETVLPYCAALSEKARRIAAVNTITIQPDGSLHGDNTDYDGFAQLLTESGISVKNKVALILGSGGSSRTVSCVLEDRGAKEIRVISRRGKNTYETIHTHKDTQLIVNTTPVGMFPHNGISPVDLTHFPNLEGVVDLIYNPHYTALLRQAKEWGIPHAGGLPMLVYQAAHSSFSFSGIEPSNVEEVLRTVEKDSLNVILCGMPGCGKTSVGKAYARLTNRPFIDTDACIEDICGIKIPHIFEKYGEDYFRAREQEVIALVSRMSGAVISLGGGSVLSKQNQINISQNSRVVYLASPLEKLSSGGRPLSKNKEAITELAKDRIPIYERMSDLTIHFDAN